MSEHIERRLKAINYHRPSEDTAHRMTLLRAEAHRFVAFLDDELPASGDAARYTALAFTALEESMMWAMKALSFGDPNAVVVDPFTGV